jgi:hypothetical protein
MNTKMPTSHSIFIFISFRSLFLCCYCCYYSTSNDWKDELIDEMDVRKIISVCKQFIFLKILIFLSWSSTFFVLLLLFANATREHLWGWKRLSVEDSSFVLFHYPIPTRVCVCVYDGKFKRPFVKLPTKCPLDIFTWNAPTILLLCTMDMFILFPESSFYKLLVTNLQQQQPLTFTSCSSIVFHNYSKAK